MVRIDKEIIVYASIENAFSYVSDLNNWHKFWQNFIEISDIKLLPNDTYSANYKYRIQGTTLNGKIGFTDYTPLKWIVLETNGGIKSTITWTFRSLPAVKTSEILLDETSEFVNNLTRVTLTIDYTLPLTQRLNKFVENPVISIHDRAVDVAITNLKEFIEYGL